jgi:Transglutaminase-like superfamily
MAGFARSHFGDRPTERERVHAICGYVRRRTGYEVGVSGPTSDAVDTLLAARGVCRDFAHLVVALCRAVDVPARVAAVYAPGLSPMDFHVVAETALDGAWWTWDATRSAPRQCLVRIATGRDAADIAFATVLSGRAELSTVEVGCRGRHRPATRRSRGARRARLALDAEARDDGVRVVGEEDNEQVRRFGENDLAEPKLLGSNRPQRSEGLRKPEGGRARRDGECLPALVCRDHPIRWPRPVPEQEPRSVEQRMPTRARRVTGTVEQFRQLAAFHFTHHTLAAATRTHSSNRSTVDVRTATCSRNI